MKHKNNLKLLPAAKRIKIEAETRKQIKERIRKCRNKKKMENKESNSIDCTTPYSNKATLNRAVSRAKKYLPSTPRRRKVVVSKLAIEESLVEPKQLLFQSETDETNEDSDADVVEKFYEQDDISRIAPGKNDVMVIHTSNGEKITKQKRHLFTSLKEAHALFLQQHPSISLGSSKFAKLRPKYVLLNSKLPHNVCMCKYHENFINAVNSLSKVMVSVPPYTHDFPNQLICDTPTQNCWLKNCDQ
ncbi:hypothetical protein JTE90_003389 [Oedothorax gibbosus]|uniref:Uncharacterized protein n=1 Tax=Oedothorax gibbosus TaxID=931172 RepID=A0AAV6TYN5_9ARAC|nr:hypothetical protein JTE90_003389 [Oedothorax gibbosus]